MVLYAIFGLQTVWDFLNLKIDILVYVWHGFTKVYINPIWSHMPVYIYVMIKVLGGSKMSCLTLSHFPRELWQMKKHLWTVNPTVDTVK